MSIHFGDIGEELMIDSCEIVAAKESACQDRLFALEGMNRLHQAIHSYPEKVQVNSSLTSSIKSIFKR